MRNHARHDLYKCIEPLVMVDYTLGERCRLCGFDNACLDPHEEARRIMIVTDHGRVCGVCVNSLVFKALERHK